MKRLPRGLSASALLAVVSLAPACSLFGANHELSRCYNAGGVFAASGLCIDTSFGDGGVFALDIGGIDNVQWAPQGLTIDAEGRLLVIGTGGSASLQNMTVLRLLDDGTLDPSFGSGGQASVDFGAGTIYGEAVRVQDNGHIVISGRCDVEGCAARLLPNGSLDVSFSGDGRQALSSNTGDGIINSELILPDGRMRFCGQAGGPGEFLLYVFGLLSNGEVETGFGDNGVAIVQFIDAEEFGGTLARTHDGKLLTAGSIWSGSSFDFGVARLLDDGTYDSTFTDAAGLAGRAVTDFAGSVDGCSVPVVQPDGRILCAGESALASGERRFSMVRYLASGALDSSFGSGGKVVLDIESFDGFHAVVLLPDGRILGGGAATNGRGDLDFALAMLEPDGSVDTSWGDSGSALFDITPEHDDELHAMTLDAEGRVVAFGFTSDGTSNNFALLRFWP